MIQTMGQILWNKQVGRSYYQMGISVDEEYANARPGQFVMVRIPGDGGLLLRRPFSIHRLLFENIQFKGVELLYQVVGKGTAEMAGMRVGEEVDILGPLGKGFTIPGPINNCFLVAGGIGIAPLAFLAGVLKRKGFHMEKVSLFLGAGSKKDLLCMADFKKFGVELHITTDDGSFGEKGLVTTRLLSELNHERPDIIYACGPVLMLKQVANISKEHDIPCQISLESMMACGMGACLGCAIKNSQNKEKYDHVCVDGPVFNLSTFQF